jgi:hypothetical protein
MTLLTKAQSTKMRRVPPKRKMTPPTQEEMELVQAFLKGDVYQYQASKAMRIPFGSFVSKGFDIVRRMHAAGKITFNA